VPSRSRRFTTIPPSRHTARDLSQLSKSIELERRIAELELDVRRLTEGMLAEMKRVTALQAQIDYLEARLALR
jgi:hypothetical protein